MSTGPFEVSPISPAGDAQAIIDATRATAEPKPVEPAGLYVVHHGQTVVETDDYAPHPRRAKGQATVYDAESFVHYVRAHEEAQTEVWQDEEAQTITAVLDSHGDVPGWGDHRVTLKLRKTPQWTRWAEQSGRMMGQGVFAEFIEDQVSDIVRPTGAEMLELAQTFQAHKGVQFESSKFLDSGHRQLVYKEDVEAKAGKRGQIEIPNTFELGIRPFLGADGYKVTARLRYRIDDGVLTLGYKLVEPEEVLRSAFDDIATEVGAGIEQTMMAGRSW